MWRIGRLAHMAGVSERTLRHYDRTGLLRPAAVDHLTGYRWYGVAELSRLERIRALQRLGLPLRDIAELLDAPESETRRAVAETLARLRADLAALTATAAEAEHYLAEPLTVVPRTTTAAARRLKVRRLTAAHPSELAGQCSGTLLTWLDGPFAAAVADDGGEPLTLPAREVVRAVLPTPEGVVRAGHDLFAWLARHGSTVAGPALEEHLIDEDGGRAVVLDIPIGRN
ncbi:MerR family transcriptional regulator [Herbidospora cretacea]|uniref:MerR family transcriptional regulator n=1 Tax=Herbidospora cretacea TaxID=28444 RepID=UPI00068F4C37|nr:MerR family transcriptional regulator [Herbidospora cretacea]